MKVYGNSLQGGTFAISYMGEYASVHNFSAIIIPPQSCHLAVGHPEKKLIPDGNNEYVFCHPGFHVSFHITA